MTLNEEIKIFEESGDHSNKGKSYTDEELRLILEAAPTKANALKFAKVFKRRTGGIEQIYRWAAASNKRIEETRPDDKFIRQIQRISKELGWIV